MTVAEAVTLIAAVASFVTAIGAVAIGWRNTGKLDTVHTIVNSQAAKFEGLARSAGFAEGQSQSTGSVGNFPTDK